MAVHASHASLPYPIRKARFSFDVDTYLAGVPTAPTSPDSEFSLDNGNYADCAEELSVPGTNRAGGLMTLSGAETDGAVVGYWLGGTGIDARRLSFYPRDLPILFSFTAGAGASGTITLPATVPGWAKQLNGLQGAILRTTGGTGGGGTGGANNQARVVASNTAAETPVVTVGTNWETAPDNTTTVDVLATAEWIARMQIAAIDQTFTPRRGVGIVSYGTLDAGGNAGTKTFTIPSAERANVQVGDWLLPLGASPRTQRPRKIDAYDSGTGVGTVDTAWPVNTGAVTYVVTDGYPGIPFVAGDFADGFLTEAKLAADAKARLLAAASVVRIDAREGTGLSITVGAGSHTTSACVASDAPSGTRTKGRIGVVVSGGIVKRAIRFSGDVGGSGAFTYEDTYGNPVSVALANADVIQVV